MAKYAAFLVGVAGPLCVSNVAHAQAWLADRRYQEGEGIRPGDSNIEIHPGVGAEVGYDSNWFQRSNKDGPNIVNAAPTAPIEDSGVLKITPSISIRSLGAQRKAGDSANAAPPTIGFNANLSGTYQEFLLAPKELRDQRNMSINAAARLDILPQHPVGFAVYGNYSRAINPNRGNPDLSFNSDVVGGGAELVLVPGSGTLDWRFGYGLTATLFEDAEARGYDNLTHNIYTKGKWGFRPRTSLLYDASFQIHNYGSNANTMVNALHDSTPLRTHIGIDGLVTPRFSVLALVGYGSTFTLNGASPQIKQYDSVIGHAELKFFLTANPGTEQASNVSLTLASIALGYNRDFQTSYLGDYYGIDRGYAKVQYMFAGRMLASLEGGVGAIEYPDIYYNGDSLAHSSFTDLRADGTLFGEYRFTNTFGLNGTLRYTANFSNTQLTQPTVNGVNGGVYDMNWRRFEAYLGVRWFL